MTSAPKTSPRNDTHAVRGPDEGSLNAIRSILTEEDEAVPRRKFYREKTAAEQPLGNESLKQRKADALPDLVQPEAAAAPQNAAPKRKFGFSLRRNSSASEGVAPKPSSAKSRKVAGAPQESVSDVLRDYRPTGGHIALGAFLLVVFFRPWLVLGLFIFFTIVMIGVFLIAGYDGFWKGVVKASRWYAVRRPSRAAILHARLDGLAVRWDAVLDRFPEGTVDGLYLPDFTELATVDARHEEAVDRRLAQAQEQSA